MNLLDLGSREDKRSLSDDSGKESIEETESVQKSQLSDYSSSDSDFCGSEKDCFLK